MTSKPEKNILGNSVVTIKELNDENTSSSFRGSITFNPEVINGNYDSLLESCPSKALASAKENGQTIILVDHGKCIMCGHCNEMEPKLIKIQSKPVLPTKTKLQLIEYSKIQAGTQSVGSYEEVGKELGEKIQKLFGRSLAIREVDAGSCNGCEIEITALNNSIYDIERFGIHFVSSPRHADVLLVTGPASRNMEIALKRTYEATPNPKIVIAVGACACSGGIFGDTYATTGGIDKVVPVDVYIPGCPPRPEALLQGLLLAVNRLKPDHGIHNVKS